MKKKHTIPAMLLCMALTCTAFLSAPMAPVHASGKADEVITAIQPGTYDKGLRYVSGSEHSGFKEMLAKSPAASGREFYLTATSTDKAGSMTATVYAGTGTDGRSKKTALFIWVPGSTPYDEELLYLPSMALSRPEVAYEAYYNPDCCTFYADGLYMIISDTSVTYYDTNRDTMETYYHRLEDGTSSYYLDYPPEPEPGSPDDPSLPAGTDGSILDTANAVLAFSVSILSAIASNPFMAFILAGSMACACICVLQQVKHTAHGG